jgi:uncharacterized membrane protein
VIIPPGVPVAWVWIANVALAVIVVLAAWRAPWSRLATDEGSHVFLGSIVALSLLWMMSGRLGATVQFHLLGATLAYLMFGLPLAVVVMTAVALVAAAIGTVPWTTVALTALVSGVLPAVIAHGVLRATEARLPGNLFIYVFGAAFFGAAVAMVASSACAALLIATGVPPDRMAAPEWLPMFVLLGFGEATLTGMLAALFVVYRPTWIRTFRDERYLRRP